MDKKLSGTSSLDENGANTREAERKRKGAIELPAAAEAAAMDDLVFFARSLSLSASRSLAFQSAQQPDRDLALALIDQSATMQAPKDSKHASNRSVDQSTEKNSTS